MTPSAPIPERTAVQRMDALERANLVRTYRAGLKRDLKARRVQFYEVLLAGQLAEPVVRWDLVETWTVFDVIHALPKYGRVKVNKVLQVARVSPSKTVGGLSERQRKELVEMVRR